MTALSDPANGSRPAAGATRTEGPAGGRRPRLTVLMATYNRAGYLEQALASVLGQSFADFEVRVFDDASQDATPEVIASVRDPRVRSFRQTTNRGWLGNCNTALEGIDTEYVLLLGDDDIMTPGALERAVAVLDTHPDVGLVHASLNIIDEAGRLVRSNVNWTKDPNVDTKESGSEFIRKSIRSGCRVCAATVMMRTEALDGLRFDPADGPTADVGLWLRIAIRWNIYFLATPGVNYRVHAGSDSAHWSLPLSTHYLESVGLILKIREMKLRFVDQNRDAIIDARRLRSVANRVAARSLLIRVLGPHAAVWLRSHRAMLTERAAGRGVPTPVHRPDMAGSLRLLVLCRQRDITRREGRAGFDPEAGRPGVWRRLSSRVDREVGGVQVHVENVVQFFEGAGSDVTVVTPFNTPWVLPVIGAATTKLLRLRNRETAERWRRHWQRLLLSWAAAKGRRRMKEPGPPVVLYAQCPIAAEVALRRRQPEWPVLLAMHSAGSEANEAYRRGDCKIGDRLYAEMEQCEQRVLPRVDGLILVSRASAEDVFQRVPATRRLPSLIAPNFLSDDWGRANGLEPSLHGDLVTVGRLAIEKNHRYLLEILAAANRMGRRYTLTVVGDGPERPALHWLRHSLGLDEQVHFLGARDEVASVLAGHRAYVHGAFAEPFGIVLIEAMAKGLPVVAGPIGGIPDVFRDGIEGRYIPLDSAVDAAAILIDLMEDPEQLERYGAAALRRFDEQFRASVVGPSIARFMGELLPHEASLYSASAAV